MAIYKPTELRDFLAELGISPKKVLSQNFLIDGNIVRKIVKSAAVVPGDVVLEIGPGPGSLTEVLLAEGATVVAVDLDRVLTAALKRLDVVPGKLHIYCENILEFPIEETLRSLLRPGQKAKIIANLPYHLTTAIITQLIDMHDLIESMTLMVQEEVARRFTAETHTKDYGSLTVFLNFYSTVKMAFKVSNQCFFPVPKVTSAVVQFKLKPPPTQIKDVVAFFKMTRAGYAHRRKVLRSSLKELYDPEVIVSALEIMGMPLARPEELSLEQFMKLFELLESETKRLGKSPNPL